MIKRILLSFLVVSLIISAASAAEWSVPIVIDPWDDDNLGLTFGTNVDATDGFEYGGGDVVLPPDPPNTVKAKKAYFEIDHQFFPYLTSDFRSVIDAGNSEEQWVLYIRSDEGMTVSWDVSGISADILVLQMVVNGQTIDMKSQMSVALPAGEYTATIVAGYGILPDAIFAADEQTAPVGATIRFSDLSTGDPTSWLWEFGDGDTSTSASPSHAYASAGLYTVTLTVENEFGTDTETKTDYITVGDEPLADFSAIPTTVVVNEDVFFTDRSVGNPTSWVWDFGDGSTSTKENPVHRYAGVGEYTVTLTVENDYGMDTIFKSGYIRVGVPPKVDFDADATDVAEGAEVAFTDLTQGDITSWAWDFGDGKTSDERNPTHVYASAGTYTVSLTAGNEFGANAETKMDYITVGEVPVAEFAAEPAWGSPPLEVSFTDMSTGNPESCVWDFGDGTTSTDEDPVHTYADEGMYAVSLTVTNHYGSDMKTVENCVSVGSGPKADFVADVTDIAIGDSVQFTDLSKGDIASWAWDFGDGATSTDQDPVHSYAAPGTYSVSLTVTNEFGEDTAVFEDYIVVGEPPVADFIADVYSGPAALSVHFTSLSAGSPTECEWDFGDGSTSTEWNPDHTYTDEGRYTVTLAVLNAYGKDVKEVIDCITCGIPPKADFIADMTSVAVSESVQFTDLSEGSPVKWLWEFGDESTSTEQNPDHRYAKSGTYSVSLTVENACGESTVTKYDYIVVASPIDAEFTADVTCGAASLCVQFTDCSIGTPTSWDWDFGDGTTCCEQNPLKYYTKSGCYSVTLTVANGEGGDTETKVSYIMVVEPVCAGFSADVTSGMSPLCVQFTDCSTGNPTSWYWDFGDGTTCSERNPVKVYSESGTYKVSLTVSNEYDCDTKSVCSFICVCPPVCPIPGFIEPPTDPNNDGIYEDINANKRLDYDDVVKYYRNMNFITQNEPVNLFDYNGNGRIDFNDLVILYKMV